MSDYFFEEAQRAYDNQLPDRYTEEPLFECDYCGNEIFLGEEYWEIGDLCYCENCAQKRTAGEE